MPELTLTRTTAEILGDSPARELLQDIFSDLHPGFIDEARSVDSIFTPQAAVEFLKQLTDLETLFEAADTYEQTVAKLQEQINGAEAMRDQLLDQVFQQLRPIERSYREIRLFF